ncbi:DUF5957 family protein [Streptomyces sp. B-S-A8]|uniref:DUF5957 family protein n=1 Tax=Streptomyces solicavernae TaxID=3043614 RepID=A0ABT6RPR6_9ACTN|nr:DUF5957 family protein [Streptomyces sp. B-S-A8]MDI3386417.1 DUF5957 family protein [Streptomyces sp. B-S-A8]
MKYALGVLGGLFGGFFAGELVAVVIGAAAHLVFDADLPFALKLMPLYLAVAGAIGTPLVLSRRAGASRPGRAPGSPYGE